MTSLMMLTRGRGPNRDVGWACGTYSGVLGTGAAATLRIMWIDAAVASEQQAHALK